MPGTKKKAKERKRISKKTAKAAGTKVVAPDAITPLYVPPPPVLGQKLLQVLQGWKEEKTQVNGVHVSDRASQKLSRQEIQDLKMVFNLTDNEKTGKVSFSDFLELVVEFEGDGRDICEEIEQGFKYLDCDNDGKVTFDNLKKACQLAGIHFSHQKLREMIAEADTNGDGAVDREEFTKVMLKTNLF
ncbi:caltractin-like isoform X2 [Polyodon spathula]|uniref:caltractin-like isoform X2 n=1 Tax=Polyodon spathula TaxID=7913 RepID=UPI001B7DA9B4|nr:caltractin-like isoform X2 [Polyodon spathula]